MAPSKFLPGDLVLVNFPRDGYWPAEITKVFKNYRREVKYFGEGENGSAFPKDMIYFNYASVENHLSNSSFEKVPAHKKALMQISDKYKTQLLKNLEDTKIADLEVRVGKERSAAASANQEIEEYKTKLENMTARVASLEALNETFEQSIKNPNKEPREVSRRRSMGIKKTITGEAKYKSKRLEVLNEILVGPGVDESHSEDKNKRKCLEEGESCSDEDKNKRMRLEEGESSMEVGESHLGEAKNYTKGLEIEESCVNKNCHIIKMRVRVVTRLEEGITPIMDLPIMLRKQSHGGTTCWDKTRSRKRRFESLSGAMSLEKKESTHTENENNSTEDVIDIDSSILEEEIIPINDWPLLSAKSKKKQGTQNKRKKNNDFVDEELEEIEEIPRCDDDENSRNGIQITVPFLSITITRRFASQEKP